MRLLVVMALSLVAARAAADEMPTAWGPTGLLHTPSAVSAKPGAIRGALFVDWFRTSSFLCTTRSPCGGVTSDEHSHSGAIASLGATLFTGFDAYLASRAYTNKSSQAPDLYQVFGDTTLGAKYSRAFGRGHAGGGAEVLLGNGPGAVGIGGAGTSFRLRALSSVVLSHARVHLGLAYLFDNTGALVRDVEADRGAPITRVERYGLGINKVDRLEANVGAELTFGSVAPFVEYGLALPINRQGYRCRGLDEGCVSGAIPSKLTVGARASTGTFSLLVGFDLGVTGTSKFASAVVPQAPYTLWLGVAMSLPFREPPPRVIVREVEAPVAPPHVVMRGFVHAAGKKEGIADARVTFVNGKRPPLLTDANGVFGADLPPGTYELRVHAEGYRDNTCGGTAVATPGNVLHIDCTLEPLPSPGE